MKTLKYIILFLLISGSIIYSLPKPKNNNIGGFMGKIRINTKFTSGILKQPTYYNSRILVENLDTKRKFIIFSSVKNGFFYSLNLTPGKYRLVECALHIKYYTIINNYFMFLYEDGIVFSVNENSITTIKPIVVLITEEVYLKHEVTQNNDSQPLIDEFKKLDKNNYWKDFNFVDFENEISTETN